MKKHLITLGIGALGALAAWTLVHLYFDHILIDQIRTQIIQEQVKANALSAKPTVSLVPAPEKKESK